MRVRIPIAVTLAAVMAVSSLGITPASAAPIGPVQNAVQLSSEQADVIQVASRKRHRANNAAAAAAFMGIVGGMIALSAQESRRDRYYNRGYYYDRGYRGHYYGGGRGYAHQPRSYRHSNPNYYGNPDHRGHPQRAPDGGWYPQNAAPDAR